MSIDVFIILTVVGVVVTACFVFYVQNRKLKMNHGIAVTFLKKHILKHRSEVRFRQKNLDTYDFLEYNLSQALVVQNDINCNFN
ncbi:hypothetical protein ACFQO1_03540 [Jejudonia soesokkakensis]|uniref:Uncharacterized protein n=1 Tax=Jejudonia soesokkakensis TaxID=1323432 RepID=A0ABW2MPT9_9FLAO